MTDQAAINMTTTSYSLSSLILCGGSIYLAITAIDNLVACYKFFAAWNLIVKERLVDLRGFVQRRRKPTLKEALQTHVSIESMSCPACCICLCPFEENEFVTACDDGCHKWFHRECLFNWLDQSDHCPCCRIDMLNKKSRGVLGDIMQHVGFNPDIGGS